MSVPDKLAIQLSCREDHRQLPGLERQARVVAPQVSPKIFAAPHQLRDVNHDGKGAGVRNIAALSDKRIKNGLLRLRNAVASCQGYSCHGILPCPLIWHLKLRRPAAYRRSVLALQWSCPTIL